MNKLPLKDRTVWKNFFMAVTVFVGAWLLLGFSIDAGTGAAFGLQEAFNILAFIAIIYGCFRIGMYFGRSHDFDRLRIKEGLSWEEFNTKYKDILNVIHQ